MHTAIHRAIIAAGPIGEIYPLHGLVRQLLWDQAPDFVRILSPICFGLAGRLASFALVPHGLQMDTEADALANQLLDQAMGLMGIADCQYVQISFGTQSPPAILAHSEVRHR